MQASDNRRNIIVGVFIFIGLVIFVVGIFTLGSQRKAFMDSISLNVIFNDIQGLKKGDNVWYSGVKIGTIKKIQFYGTSQVQVFFDIEEEAHQYIHKDALASISSDGLIGNKIIVITGGSQKFPFVEDGDRLRVNVTLSTDEIMKTFQVNNKNLVEITSAFKAISANLLAGKGTAGALLSDEQMAQNLRAVVVNLRNTAQAADRMIAELNTFTRTINTKDGLANKIFTDTVVFARLQTSVDELQKISQAATAVTENINTASVNFKNASAKLNQTDNPAGLLLNDQPTAAQLKEILKNLEMATHNLNEDLKALQSNFLFRGYFRRLEREAEKEAEKE